MTGRSLLKLVLVVFVTLLVQSTIGVDITIFGAHPDLMLLLPIAAGIAGDAEEGAVMGFVAGLAADLLLPTPFGLSALVFCLVGFAVGASTGAVTREVWWFPPLVALAASAVAVMLYAVIGAVLGQEQFLRVDLAAYRRRRRHRQRHPGRPGCPDGRLGPRAGLGRRRPALDGRRPLVSGVAGGRP